MANQLPLPALLHIAILTLMCNVAISKNRSLAILLKRQCPLRVRKSWTMNAHDTLDKYDMGTIDDIFESDKPRLTKKHLNGDTEGVEQTTEGGVRRQSITASAPPTPARAYILRRGLLQADRLRHLQTELAA